MLYWLRPSTVGSDSGSTASKHYLKVEKHGGGGTGLCGLGLTPPKQLVKNLDFYEAHRDCEHLDNGDEDWNVIICYVRSTREYGS